MCQTRDLERLFEWQLTIFFFVALEMHLPFARSHIIYHVPVHVCMFIYVSFPWVGPLMIERCLGVVRRM